MHVLVRFFPLESRQPRLQNKHKFEFKSSEESHFEVWETIYIINVTYNCFRGATVDILFCIS